MAVIMDVTKYMYMKAITSIAVSRNVLLFPQCVLVGQCDMGRSRPCTCEDHQSSPRRDDLEITAQFDRESFVINLY